MTNVRLEKSRLRLLTDRPDQFLFVVAFTSGLLLILFLKFFFEGVAAFLALFFAVSIIVAYALVAFSYRGIRLPEDRIGDNCYYLGFLFTLVSLSSALYSFSHKGLDAQDLVADFGVALGSTIAGIFVRVVIQQMRIDSEQIGQDVRMSMTELALETSADLQNVKEEVATLSEGFKLTLKKSADELQEVSNKSITRLKTLVGRLDEAASSSAISVSEFKTSIDASLAGMAEAFDRARSNISQTSINAPSNLFTGLQGELRKLEISMSHLSGQISGMNAEVINARTSWLEKVATEKFEFPEAVFSPFKSVLTDLLSTVKNLNEEITCLQNARNLSEELRAQRFVSLSNESIDGLTKSLNRGRVEFEEFFGLLQGMRESLQSGQKVSTTRTSRWRSMMSRAFWNKND